MTEFKIHEHHEQAAEPTKNLPNIIARPQSITRPAIMCRPPIMLGSRSVIIWKRLSIRTTPHGSMRKCTANSSDPVHQRA
jgi:hypothetical protein